MVAKNRGVTLIPLITGLKALKAKTKTGTRFCDFKVDSRGVEKWIFIEVNPISYNTQFSAKDSHKFREFQKQMYWNLKEIVGLNVPANCRYALMIEVGKFARKADSSNYYKPIEDVIKLFGSDDENCEHFSVSRKAVASEELNGVRFKLIPLVKNWKVKSTFSNKKYKNTNLISICNQMKADSVDEFFVKKSKKRTKKSN